MFEKGMFPFDAEKMAEMFKVPDMTKMFETMKLPGFDPQAMMETQKKNVEALVAANQAAAAGYQDFFKKQMAIFEETMHTAQAQIAAMGEGMSPDSAAKQADLYKVAFEKALANMTELAEAAKKANEEAFAIVSARVKESIAELQALAPKM
ncbi:MAG: TIGR01841 family phasin [Rubrimonas sp.]|uniref:TIGR01841 family phasin n=1 Tax=Rubrimonas sp. TaxID=2036015 RepID=UPI002FDC8DB2